MTLPSPIRHQPVKSNFRQNFAHSSPLQMLALMVRTYTCAAEHEA